MFRRAPDPSRPRAATPPAATWLACGALLLLCLPIAASVAPDPVGLVVSVARVLGGASLGPAALLLGGVAVGVPACRALPGLRRVGGSTAVTLGFALWVWVLWVVAWLGAAHAAWVWAGALAGVGVLAWRLAAARRAGALSVPALPWTAALWVPGLAVLLVAAACPPGVLWQTEAFGYDVLSYHLQLPREWFALGRVTGLEHSAYSFLPSLAEAATFHLAVLRGDAEPGLAYDAQALHAAVTVLAAVNVTALARTRFAAPWAALAGSAVLLTPWVLVTGSMAYNEGFALAFGAAALRLVLRPGDRRVERATAAGVLLGVATLAKLTAGPMLAVPIGLVLLAGWKARGKALPVRRRVLPTVACVAAGLVVLSPYLVRNAMQTGNPVFPLATGVFGNGHWDDALAERWDAGHHGPGRLSPDALWQQYAGNAGYSVIGGREVERDTRNIARFPREGGVSPLLLAAGGGLALLLVRRGTRGLASALALVWLAQVLVWCFATHQQSRFLVFTVLPVSVLVAGGFDTAARRWATGRGRTLVRLGAGAWGVALAGHAVALTWTQAVTPPEADRPVPLFLLVGFDGFALHPIDQLPGGSKTLLVADHSRLFMIQSPIAYASAFDASPLGEVIRRVGEDPAAIADALREDGVTHVWVHRAEVERLHATYGFDADAYQALPRLIRAWTVQGDAQHHGPAVLLTLPTDDRAR